MTTDTTTTSLTEATEYQNTRFLIDHVFGGVMAQFAKVLDRTPQQVGSMFKEPPSRPVGEAFSRYIETCLGLPENWLSDSHSHEEKSRAAQVAAHKLSISPAIAQRRTMDLRKTGSAAAPATKQYSPATPTPTTPVREDTVRAPKGKVQGTQALCRRDVDSGTIENFLRLINPEVDVFQGLPYNACNTRTVQKLIAARNPGQWFTAVDYSLGPDQPEVYVITAQTMDIIEDASGRTIQLGAEPDTRAAATTAVGDFRLGYYHVILAKFFYQDKPTVEKAILLKNGSVAEQNRLVEQLTYEGIKGVPPHWERL